MDLSKIQAALPEIEALAAAFDPAIAGYAGIAQAVLDAAQALQNVKATVSPELWAAQVNAFNIGAQAIKDAEG